MRLGPGLLSVLALTGKATAGTDAAAAPRVTAAAPDYPAPNAMWPSMGRSAFDFHIGKMAPKALIGGPETCMARETTARIDMPQPLQRLSLHELAHREPGSKIDPQLAGAIHTLMERGYSDVEIQGITMAYRRAAIPLNEKTVPGDCNDKQRIGELIALDGGRHSEVFRATFMVGKEGKQFQAVFKLADAGGGGEVGDLLRPLTERMGIRAPTRFSMRNIASAAIDRLLGADVIPHTEFAVNNGKLGIVMEYIDGKPPSERFTYLNSRNTPRLGRFLSQKTELEKYPERYSETLRANRLRGLHFPQPGVVVVKVGKSSQAFDSRHPVFLEKSTYLQIGDYIRGEDDRHPANWKVETAPLSWVANKGERAPRDAVRNVKGIDNDISLGDAIMGEQERYDAPAGHATLLPPFIDRTMYKKVMRISGNMLAETLAGLQSDASIKAAQLRLNDVKIHFTRLLNSGAVIDPDDWHKHVDDPRLYPHNSYYARENTDLPDYVKFE